MVVASYHGICMSEWDDNLQTCVHKCICLSKSHIVQLRTHAWHVCMQGAMGR